METNKHGIRVLDGKFSKLEIMLMKEKEPDSPLIPKPKGYRYPTLKYALIRAGR